jgi:hypothetical protein
MALENITIERLKWLYDNDDYYNMRLEEEKVYLQTDNLNVVLNVFNADTIAHSVGCTVFEKEDVKKYRKAAQKYYDDAIAIEPENPVLWWKKAWYLSIIGGDGTEELKQALLNVIKFSKNKKYRHMGSDVNICKHVLKDDYGIISE